MQYPDDRERLSSHETYPISITRKNQHPTKTPPFLPAYYSTTEDTLDRNHYCRGKTAERHHASARPLFIRNEYGAPVTGAVSLANMFQEKLTAHAPDRCIQNKKPDNQHRPLVYRYAMPGSRLLLQTRHLRRHDLRTRPAPHKQILRIDCCNQY